MESVWATWEPALKKLERRGLAGKELQRLCTQQHPWILYHTYTTERHLLVGGQASREMRVMTLTGTKGLCEEPSGLKGKRTLFNFLSSPDHYFDKCVSMLTNRNSEFAPVALLDLMKRRGRTWLLPYWAKGLKDKESRLVTNPTRI